LLTRDLAARRDRRGRGALRRGARPGLVRPPGLFFGGTALSRTHLPDVRLSEDIDLISTGPRADVAAGIERALRRLRRTHGTVTLTPPLARTKGAAPSVLRTQDELTVHVQLLRQEGYPRWPTEVFDIEQRYSDSPPAPARTDGTSIWRREAVGLARSTRQP